MVSRSNAEAERNDRSPLGAAPIDCIHVPAGKTAAIVTSLEMLAAPPARNERNGFELRLQRRLKPDVAWYRELFRRVGNEWLWFSRLQLDDGALRALLDDPLIEVYALEDASGSVGLLELDFRVSDECELSFFGLVAGLVGSGAGRWLMNRGIEIAWSRPIRRFWVHTCTHDHPAALPFYIRSGFRAFQQHVEIFDDPRVLGTLPLDAAPHVPVIAQKTT